MSKSVQKKEHTMKFVKRIFSLTLCLLLCISALSVNVAAAATSPSFNLSVVSQSTTQVTLRLSLTGGSFSSFDFMIVTGQAIKSCSKLYTTDEFDNYCKQLRLEGEQCADSAYTVSQKMSFATTGSVSGNVSICNIVLNKNTSADITANDVSIAFSECVVRDSSGEHKLGSAVKVSYSFGTVNLSEHNVTLNYKKSCKLNAESTFSEVQWTSSNESVAKVDQNGNVTTYKTGSAVITCASSDGSVSDTCQVTVKYSVLQWIIVIVLFGWIWY